MCVVNRGIEHELHSRGRVTFVEALGPVPLDHIPDPSAISCSATSRARSTSSARARGGRVRARARLLARSLVLGAARARARRARPRCSRDRSADRGSERGPDAVRRARRRGPPRRGRRRDPRRALASPARRSRSSPATGRSGTSSSSAPSFRSRAGASPTATRRTTSTFRDSSGTRGRVTTEPRTGPIRRRPVRCFYHDCTAADAAWAVSRLRPQSAAPRLEPWPADALPDVERTSILCRDERVIDPSWSRQHVARAARRRGGRARRRALAVPLAARASWPHAARARAADGCVSTRRAGLP